MIFLPDASIVVCGSTFSTKATIGYSVLGDWVAIQNCTEILRQFVYRGLPRSVCIMTHGLEVCLLPCQSIRSSVISICTFTNSRSYISVVISNGVFAAVYRVTILDVVATSTSAQFTLSHHILAYCLIFSNSRITTRLQQLG